LGIHPIVFEEAEQPGGMIATVRRNGFVFEAGPQCPRFPASVWALVRELNLEREFVYGDPKAKRYILKQGLLHPAPFSAVGIMTTQLIDLRSKLRFLGEPFGNTYPPDREESLAEFVERKFGSDVLEFLVDPVISTVFLGDSRKMGMESAFPMLVDWERSQGSLVRGAIRGSMAKRRRAVSDGSRTPNRDETNRRALHLTDALPSLGSFRSGMGMLPERLSEAIGESMHYRVKAESVEPVQSENGVSTIGWRVRVSGGEEIKAESLVLAVPAYVAARLLEKSAPQLGAMLGEIDYAPISSVSAAYERAQVSHPLVGFGCMVPRREGLNIICTFWNSSLFRGHAPEGKVLMTSFVRGDSSAALAASSDEECVRAIHAENARILGIRGEPFEKIVWRYPRALPQYNVGHAKRVAEIHRLLETLPSLGLVGNYLTGRSIGDCVELASLVAAGLHSRFRGSNI
jgi:protoporphyrinogen/coproporphyrinogen III oxidase